MHALHIQHKNTYAKEDRYRKVKTIQNLKLVFLPVKQILYIIFIWE